MLTCLFCDLFNDIFKNDLLTVFVPYLTFTRLVNGSNELLSDIIWLPPYHYKPNFVCFCSMLPLVVTYRNRHHLVSPGHYKPNFYVLLFNVAIRGHIQKISYTLWVCQRCQLLHGYVQQQLKIKQLLSKYWEISIDDA